MSCIQKHNQRLTIACYRKALGYTLLELIVVIILLGTLAATVLPKFQTSQGIEEYTYRSESITKLRALQLRAMQQTSGVCHQVVIDETHLGKPNTNPCTTSAGISNGTEPDEVTVVIESNYDVEFDVPGGTLRFEFDQLGRPQNGCSPCQIDIVGSERLSIRIEEEGYIHAVP